MAEHPERRPPSHWRRQRTLHQGHTDDLVYESEMHRVWVSRMTVDDGAPENDQVTIEHNDNGRWVIEAESRGNRWHRVSDVAGLAGTTGVNFRLVYLPPNMAYAFKIGDSIVQLDGESRFFDTRKEAVAAAKSKGLRVDHRGAVSTIYPEDQVQVG